MKRRLTFLASGFVILIVPLASAAADGDQGSSDSLKSTLLSFLPIVLFLLILWFLFRRQMRSPLAGLQQKYLERQIEHTQRVAELLGRIASALEASRQHDAQRNASETPAPPTSP